jgi:hypothetical protein
MATQLADVQANGNDDALMEAYVRRWFIPFETLVRRSGGTADQIGALIAAGAAPGAIYVRCGDGEWWSPLQDKNNRTPPAGSECWYNPGALYWLRRALLAVREGASPAEAAELNREAFLAQFVTALKAEPLAPANYPDAFDGTEINLEGARRLGASEWNDWRNGGFAVCLRSFTGASCVTKESLAKTIKKELAGEERTFGDLELLDLLERLTALLLPFAPFERPACTPGKTIDPFLELLQLGCEEPYGVEG